MSTVDLPLLPLGRGRDLSAERGVECPGDLPAASDPDLVERARRAKEALGDRVFVLGHHYQRDEVIQFADVTGDSFKLARDAAARPEAEFIVFRGVHFMAESADILTKPEQQVVLPDLAAGCSMADMARLTQVEAAWDAMAAAGVQQQVVPVTYMNSSADIKAFCGRNGGVVCTSSNAQTALEWAYEQQEQQLRDARMILWKGHCSVHGRFSEDVVDDLRAADPDINILVHPECKHEVVLKADLIGSTEFIIQTIEAAPAGSSWAIGTELNLVKRLADSHPDKKIAFLDRNVCYCSTMNRIDLPHLGTGQRGEDPLTVGLRHTEPVVDDLDAPQVAVRTPPDLDACLLPRRGELRAVGHEVLQHRPQLHRVALDRGEVVHGEVGAEQRHGQVGPDVGHHRRQVDRAALHLPPESGVGQQVVDQALHPLGTAVGPGGDVGQRVGVGLRGLHLLLEQLQRHPHRRQRVAQVVGDLAGEGREHLVGALQLGPGGLHLTAVERGSVSKTHRVPITTPAGVRSWWVA